MKLVQAQAELRNLTRKSLELGEDGETTKELFNSPLIFLEAVHYKWRIEGHKVQHEQMLPAGF